MKVIHIVTNFDLGGSERVAINIAKAKRNAIEYHIIEVCKGNSQFSKELIQEIIKSNIKPHRSIISNHKLGIIFFPFRLFYLIYKLKPQIIHTHAEIADLSVCIFYYLFHIFFPKLKYVRTIHSTELWVQWKKIGNWCEQHFFKTNVQNVAISQATKEMYEKDYGNVNIPIIYNGIEIQEKNKFNNINKNKLNVVFAGRLVNLKGTDILIKIIKSLENSNIYSFYIIGDGEEKTKIELEIGNFKNVHIYSKVHNLSNYLWNFDFILVPSYREGLSLITIEAGTSGVIPIINSCIGLNETVPSNWPFKIKNNKTDIYVKYFKDILPKIDITEYSNRIKQFTKEHFSIKKMQNDYEDIYLKL